MGDSIRNLNKIDQYSPSNSNSPRGSRSPGVSRQDSTGTLKATISLGKNPSIIHTGPFYLIKEPPTESELTGATNLMAHNGLEHSYNKSSGRKVRDSLSSFLPNLPGIIDQPGHADNSSLRSVIDKPPIGGKEFLPFNSVQLSGFRLHPGPLPESYRYLNQPQQKRKKLKKNKKERDYAKSVEDGGEIVIESTTQVSASSSSGGVFVGSGSGGAGELMVEKKHKDKKQKRRDDDERERKKRKKEKKKEKKKKESYF